MKPNLAVVIVTLNEEKELARCLESVKGLTDEIIVVDSGSTDKTLDIAKKFGAKIYHRDFDNFAAQKNFAAGKADSIWIFSLDADEEASLELRGNIKSAVSSDKYSGYLIPRRNFMLGGEIKHSRWSPDKHIWLWKKGKGEWKGRIHEEVVVEGEVGELIGAKIHHSYNTVSEFMGMINSYTSFESEEKIKKGEKFSVIKLFIDPVVSFVGRYFYKKGFLDGWRGFVLCSLRGYYKFVTWAKVWEHEL